MLNVDAFERCDNITTPLVSAVSHTKFIFVICTHLYRKDLFISTPL